MGLGIGRLLLTIGFVATIARVAVEDPLTLAMTRDGYRGGELQLVDSLDLVGESLDMRLALPTKVSDMFSGNPDRV